VGAVADLAELVLSGHATSCAVGACAALHSGTFLAGYTANTDFHKLAFSLFKAVCAFGYLYLEFVRFCCCKTTIAYPGSSQTMNCKGIIQLFVLHILGSSIGFCFLKSAYIAETEKAVNTAKINAV
jgi:hypothetical protein